jgi:hypothetical protein
MTSLVFVHGTGVRQARSAALADTLRRYLGEVSDPTVISCSWGDTDGAAFGWNGASLPTRDADPTDPAGRWQLLYADPLFELAALGIAEQGRLPLDDEQPGEKVRAWLAQLAVNPAAAPSVAGRMSDLGQMDAFRLACEKVLVSREFDMAVRAAGDSFDVLVETTARAVVATILAQTIGDGIQVTPAGSARDRNVADLVTSFGGLHLGLATGAARRALSLVERAGGGRWIQRQRRGMAMFAADILRYQTHGEPVRDTVRAAVGRAAAISTPVALVGHSLGGVASFEALVRSSLPEVGLLVTVGSQAPFFYEVDALASLRFGEPLPDHMPEWLNIWDSRDVLAMLGQPVFGPRRVTDAPVDNGQPFPFAHSAYWENPDVYKLLRSRLPGRAR